MLQPGNKTYQMRVDPDSLNDFKQECKEVGVSMAVILRMGAHMALEHFKQMREDKFKSDIREMA